MSKFSEYLVVVALPKMFVVAPRACVPQISRVKYAMSLIVRGAEKTSKREGSVKSACRKLWRLFFWPPLAMVSAGVRAPNYCSTSFWVNTK